MSTFVCEGGERGGVEADTGGAWEGERLAGVFWPVLVSLAPHTGNKCFCIPGSFSLYEAPPRSTREPGVRKVSPAVPFFPHSALLPSQLPPSSSL